MAFDRFEFEEELMTAWGVTSDIHDLATGVMEHDMTTDQIANVLLGLEVLYNLRFERLLNRLEHSLKSPVSLLPPQEPLGEPFSTVLYNNAWEMYDDVFQPPL